MKVNVREAERQSKRVRSEEREAEEKTKKERKR